MNRKLYIICGNEEVWADIIDDKVKDIYEINNFGVIRNKKSGYIISQKISNDGYYEVILESKKKKNNCRRRVHRLVMQSFEPIENYKKMEVHHRDRDRLNNSIFNLYWLTREEHTRITIADGSRKILKDESHPKNIHDIKLIESICILLSKRKGVYEIIDLLKLDNTLQYRMLITDIWKKKLYKSISDKFDIPEFVSSKNYLTIDDVHTVCKMLEEGKSYFTILRAINRDNTANNIAIISGIRNKKTYVEISDKYNFPDIKYIIRHTDEYVHEICKLLETGCSTNEILHILGIEPVTSEKQFIRKVKRREAFTYISKDYNF